MNIEKLEIVELDANSFTSPRKDDNSLNVLAENILENIPRKLTVFFDSANFLMTDYFLSGSGNAVMLIETDSGKQFQIHNCNCGYGGRGPSNTEKILGALGMSPESAKQIISQRAFQINFTDDGRLDEASINTDFPFDSRSEHLNGGAIALKDVAVNLEQKQLYFFDCTGKNVVTVFECIDLVKVESFEYYIGDDCHSVRDFNIPYVPSFLKSDNPILNGSFIWINAKPFSIICFIGNDAPFSYVNTIGSAVSGRILFNEKYTNLFPNIETNIMSSMSPWQRIKLIAERIATRNICYHDVVFIKGGR